MAYRYIIIGLIAAILIAAVVTGTLFYRQMGWGNGIKSSPSPDTISQEQLDKAASLSAEKRLVPKNLKPAEDYLVKNNLASGAAEEKIEMRFEQAQQAAVETSTIEIKDCVVTPFVVSAKDQQTITVKNADSTPHTLSFTPQQKLTVEGKGSGSFKVDFGTPPLLTNYIGSCNSQEFTGYILVK